MDVSKMKPIPMTCPTCGRKFLSDETPTPPFCTSRCQLIDLGRWFNEEIGVPYEGEPGDTPVEYRDETLPESDA
ncbi:zinc-binding protein [Rhodopirellula sallentina SM41]|uniref:DNA gyrase inhibitor YacG n=2 Tax=Pirellulaceae TaxID=2691357 RepID=M5TX15_9BACT|nr:zinc-binding protein [Rhodopirellula sallentina SM41]